MLVLPFLGKILSGPNFQQDILIGDFNVNIYVLFAIIILLFFSKSFLTFLALRYNAKTRSILLKNLKNKVFTTVIEKPYLDFIEGKSGEYQSLLNEQVARALQSFIQFSHMNSQIIQLVIYGGLGILVAPVFGLTAIVISVLIAVVLLNLNRRVRYLSNINTKYSIQLSEDFNEITNNFQYLKVTGRIKNVQTKILDAIDTLAIAHLKVGILAGFTLAIKEPLGIMVLTIAVVVSYYVHDYSFANLLTSSALFYRAFACVMGFQISRQNTIEYFSSFEKLLEFFKNSSQSNKSNIRENSLKIYRNAADLSIVVENITLIISNKPILRNISLELSDKSINAIVGPSGSGKSKLVQVICGLLEPSSGSVKFNGRDISQLDWESWRDRLGYVSPEGVLFSGTIAQNIHFDFSDREFGADIQCKVESCLGSVGLLNYVKSLPLGIDTNLSEKGASLSAGQRQRLLIARELYKSPRLLILDEATSALDQHSQKTITDLMSELKNDMMIIVIAHRHEALKGADHLWSVKDGSVQKLLPKDLYY